MGAATERSPEQVLEDGLRKRKDGLSPEPGRRRDTAFDAATSRVMPITQVWKPSQRVQNITIWVLLLAATFFSVAVVIEELQASWYRLPALDALNSQFFGSQSLDLVLKSTVRPGGGRDVVGLRWNVSRGARRPDGLNSMVCLINGELPGPTIQALPGDTIHLEVTSSFDGELDLTFGGLAPSSKNIWAAMGSAQKPVTAGSTKIYEVQVPSDKTGTFAYRAASRDLTACGVFGAIVVADPAAEILNGTVDEERVILLNDWLPSALASPYEPSTSARPPASVLVNGKGAYNCSQLPPDARTDCASRLGKSRPHMKFDAGKVYRLRLVNAGTASGISVSIPGTYMTIIEMDGGQKVQPKRATSVGVLRPGQTVDVLIDWTAGGDDEFIVSVEDDAGDATLSQHFPIKVSGFLNRNAQPPPPRHRDLLRLIPLS
ncbi:uncharacterized protein PV09_06677 [Verruconis gallopava]|uniref:Plastocyanin-like domain-containing protein n=1 Tax=Verruconis gallopava TaxID=253628 RepID=A0A0D2A5J8_9PEZI|nr:uncharacterized protein PV09_06677 [Verruconis gallopava]KIW01825.1 hypothetical protein PV09_06677 [Verruconis gallopava]